MIGLFKRFGPFPLTDEQVIREALKATTPYARAHPDDMFVVNDCVDHVLSAVESVWRRARGYSSYRNLSRKDEKELTGLSTRVQSELRARACKKALEYKKGRIVQNINRSTAEALILYELRQRDCEFYLEFQAQRVKISIRINDNTAQTLTVKYKEIHQGRLTEILDAGMAIIKQINSGLSVIISTGWKDFSGWQK